VSKAENLENVALNITAAGIEVESAAQWACGMAGE